MLAYKAREYKIRQLWSWYACVSSNALKCWGNKLSVKVGLSHDMTLPLLW